MSRIIIGALTAWQLLERRRLCLDMWMADADAMNVDALFLFAAARLAVPELLGNHSLALPCLRDAYDRLPQLTRGFCQWALTRTDWDYLFKCDDDTYTSIPRLLNYDLAGRDYVGAEWRPGVRYGSGGAGYFLSRRAAEIVAENLTQITGPEDLLVGKVLRDAGIKFSIEPRFVPFGTIDKRPKRNNALITVHACAAAWAPAHAETGLRAS